MSDPKFAHHYDNPRLTLWMRVVLYAHDHDGDLLDRGQLRAAIDPQARSAEISRAVRHAVRAGILTCDSSTRRLAIARARRRAA